MANNKKGINPLAAGVAGAVIGAGVAAVASQTISNPKVKKKTDELVNKAKDMADNAKERFYDQAPEVEKKVKTVRKKASKKLKEAKKN